MFKYTKNIISVVLIVSFILTSAIPSYGFNGRTLFTHKSHAQRYLKDKEGLTNIIETPSLLDIPQSIGRIVESYKGGSDSLIIHIQDRHIDPATQSNISSIIEQLNTKYNVNLMCLEGASEELDTSFYDKYEAGLLKEKIAGLFMQQGLFTGAEFYKINNADRYLKAVGAENKKAYLDHLNSYRKNQVNKDAVLRLLNGLEQAAEELKQTIYTKDLKALDDISDSYEAKSIKLPEYLALLKKYSKKSKTDITKYKDLEKFIQLTEKEKRIDFKKAEEEREHVIKALSENLDEADAKELVRMSIDFRFNRISDIAFYDYFQALLQATDCKIAAKDYKSLTGYIDYLKFSKTINHLNTFDEAESLEEDVQAGLCKNQEQRQLLKYAKAVDMLKDLYNLKFTHRHLDYMDENKESFDIVKIQQFLKDASTRYGLDIQPYVVETRIDRESLEHSKEFYRLALERDMALAENTLKNLKKYHKKKAILITGGFHTQGITNILKERDISYVVICPTIGLDDCDRIYNDRMQGEFPSIDTLKELFVNMLSAPLCTGDAAGKAVSAGAQERFAAIHDFASGVDPAIGKNVLSWVKKADSLFSLLNAERNGFYVEVDRVIGQLQKEGFDATDLNRRYIEVALRRIFEEIEKVEFGLANASARDVEGFSPEQMSRKEQGQIYLLMGTKEEEAPWAFDADILTPRHERNPYAVLLLCNIKTGSIETIHKGKLSNAELATAEARKWLVTPKNPLYSKLVKSSSAGAMDNLAKELSAVKQVNEPSGAFLMRTIVQITGPIYGSEGIHTYVKTLLSELASRNSHLRQIVFYRSHSSFDVKEIKIGNSELILIPLEEDRKDSWATKVNDILNVYRADLIINHTPTYPEGVLASQIAAERKIPFIAYVHFADYELERPEIRERLHNALSDNSTQILTVSSKTTSAIVEKVGISPERVHTVGALLDTKKFNPSSDANRSLIRALYNIDEDEILILAPSIFAPEKGTDDLIMAIEQLKTRHKVKVICVGARFMEDREFHEKVLRYVQEHNLEDNILFFNSVNQEILSHFYAASDVVVLPAPAGARGLVLIEAALMEKPAVAYSIKGVEGVIRNGVTGLLSKWSENQAKRVKRLANTLKKLIDSPDKRLAMGQEARKRALENFDTDKRITEHEQFYAKAIRIGPKASSAGLVRSIKEQLRGQNERENAVLQWLDTPERKAEAEEIITGIDQPDTLLYDLSDDRFMKALANLIIKRAESGAESIRIANTFEKTSSAGALNVLRKSISPVITSVIAAGAIWVLSNVYIDWFKASKQDEAAFNQIELIEYSEQSAIYDSISEFYGLFNDVQPPKISAIDARFKIGKISLIIQNDIKENAEHIIHYADKYHLGPHYLAAIILTEQLDKYSKGFLREDTTDRLGALVKDTSIGLCQVRISTFKRLCAGLRWGRFGNKITEELSTKEIVSLLENPEVNIMVAAMALDEVRKPISGTTPTTDFKLRMAQAYTSSSRGPLPQPPFSKAQLEEEAVRTAVYAHWVLINEKLLSNMSVFVEYRANQANLLLDKSSSAGTKILGDEMEAGIAAFNNDCLEILSPEAISYVNLGNGRITFITNVTSFTETDRAFFEMLNPAKERVTIVVIDETVKDSLKTAGFTGNIMIIDDYGYLVDGTGRSWDTESMDNSERIAMIAADIRGQNRAVITVTDSMAAIEIGNIMAAKKLLENDRKTGTIVVASMNGATQQTQIGNDVIDIGQILFSVVAANGLKEGEKALQLHKDQQLYVITLPAIDSLAFEKFIYELTQQKSAMDAAASAA